MMTNAQAKRFYVFGVFRIDVTERLLFGEKGAVTLTPKAFDTLLFLVESAVMDAVGSERAALCGVSEGGPKCSLFAATYPEKTLALVMIGTYAKRVRDDEYPWAPTAEQCASAATFERRCP